MTLTSCTTYSWIMQDLNLYMYVPTYICTHLIQWCQQFLFLQSIKLMYMHIGNSVRLCFACCTDYAILFHVHIYTIRSIEFHVCIITTSK